MEVPQAVELVNGRLEKLRPLAYPNRISTYFRIDDNNGMKAALMKYGYVLISMKWYGRSSVVNGVYQYDKDSECSYHALAVYGRTPKGWLVANSWGEHWGDNGTFNLPFDFAFSEAGGVTDAIVGEESDIVTPKRNWFMDFLYRLMNGFLRLFKMA